MLNKDTTMTFRINKDLKERTSKVSEDMGMDLSTAITMFLVRLDKDHELPFKPSTKTELEMAIEDIKKGNISKAHTNHEELIKDLTDGQDKE
ncbi:type II toxin-antitoxin system RelB/DinJ family antitoxin [Companilactobacillus ginsenosidimutans]|uniref:Damage-inducible protein J n=1 Tax=Companilactobacillus ginsenosidimutans TaxID=1007676 RepID=A0A0H4QGZ9_9LACO|nr:type II toxin-antitoxin system RelB/DinJ family antitoxin [Companilactobacillus ginsenosidimutans]AKP67689.1 hypothetical protein ABM34_09220 [Companilactobacillus ginsenosidimutans]